MLAILSFIQLLSFCFGEVSCCLAIQLDTHVSLCTSIMTNWLDDNNGLSTL